MDQFVIMSPFYYPFHLGTTGIIDRARAVQTRILAFYVMDQFLMMSPFDPPFHLGAEGIIEEARALQKLLRSLNRTFHNYRSQTD